MWENRIEGLRKLELGRSMKILTSRVGHLHWPQGSSSCIWKLNSMNRHKKRLDRRIRRDGEHWLCDQKKTLLHHSTLYQNRLLEYFFCFLIVDSMICNPNIYSRGAEGPSNKLSPSSLSLYCSGALLLFLSDWVFLFVSFIKSLYKISLKGISHFKKDLVFA